MRYIRGRRSGRAATDYALQTPDSLHPHARPARPDPHHSNAHALPAQFEHLFMWGSIFAIELACVLFSYVWYPDYLPVSYNWNELHGIVYHVWECVPRRRGTHTRHTRGRHECVLARMICVLRACAARVIDSLISAAVQGLLLLGRLPTCALPLPLSSADRQDVHGALPRVRLTPCTHVGAGGGSRPCAPIGAASVDGRHARPNGG